MDLSYILSSAVPDDAKLMGCGFIKSGDTYTYKVPLSEKGFYALLTLTDSKMTAEVFESEDDTKYAMFDMKKAHGSFVASMREEVQAKAEDIKKNCFVSNSLNEKYYQHIKDTYNVEPEYLWKDLPDYGVLKCSNGKWFAIVMKVPFSKLGIESEEPVWIVNLKVDGNRLSEIINNRNIFPAYHMNKKLWVSVLLTSVTDFDMLKSMTETSKRLVEKK